jgi:NADH:ubiquinone oxidoreductase subunit
MRIAIYLTVEDTEEATTISELLKPWHERSIQVSPSTERVETRAREKRKQRILMHFPTEPLPIGQLYKRLKQQHVITLGYKAFAKDICELISIGKLHGTRQRGRGGNTTLLSIKH